MTEKSNYTQEQNALLRLQELENEGRAMSRAFQDHNAHKMRTQMTSLGGKVLEEYQKLSERKKELEKKITSHDDELQATRAKIAEEKATLNQTSDPRTAQALSRSVDTLERRIDKLEFDLLGLMEQKETEELEFESKKEQVNKLKQAIAEVDKGLKELHDQVNEKLSVISQERAKMLHQIRPEIVEKYRKAAMQNSGIGVEEFTGSTGSVCSLKYSLTQRDEILASTGQIVVCPSCRRLMVIPHA